MNVHTNNARKFPRLSITYEEAVALPEYTYSNPTDVSVGKMWRRRDGDFGKNFQLEDYIWLIGRYEAARSRIDPDGTVIEMAATMYYRPVIRVKAKTETVIDV